MFSLASPARAAERGRWARRRKSKSASGSRVRGNIGLWLCRMVKASVSCLVCWQNLGRGCAGRESIRLHHVFFWALVVVRGVSVCSSPPVFQPGVVQACPEPVEGPSVAPLDIAWVSGWAARFRFWLGRREKYRPCPKPNPALKGTRGYALACFPLVWSARAP